MKKLVNRADALQIMGRRTAKLNLRLDSYGLKTLPGVREAIEQRDYQEAQEQINALSTAINQLSSYLMSVAQ